MTTRRRLAIDRPQAPLAALAGAAGIVDAVSYLMLGHVFTANMTGNTVLLGLSLGQGKGADAARSAVALGGFCAGVALGAALAGRGRHDERWPRRVTAVVAVEALALCGLAGASAATGSPTGGLRLGLIVISALAMGLQSGAVRRVGVSGVATTYVTGTLTNAIATLVDRLGSVSALGQNEQPARGLGLPTAIWLIYGLGAVTGGGLSAAWGGDALWPAAAVVAAVAATTGARR